MSHPKFTYGEAISRGWAMTKKHFGIILLLFLVNLAIGIPGAIMGNFTGSFVVDYDALNETFKDPDERAPVLDYLKESGYITDFMMIRQEKLKEMSGPDSLDLSPEFENKRHEIYDFLKKHKYRLPFPKPVYYLLSLGLWLVQMLVSVGLLKASLMIARDQEPALTELFSNGHLLIAYLVGGLCYGLIILGGALLLVIPGIIFSIVFSMYAFLIIDKGLDPIAALKRSREITKGSRLHLLGFGFVILLLNFAGLLCLIIGVAVTATISWIAAAFIYDRLENEGEAPPAVTFEAGPETLPPPYQA